MSNFEKYRNVFETLKKVFILNIILRYYNLDYKVVIEIDVSNYIFEDILFQYNKDKVFYLIAYFLKKHNSIEYNYKINNKKFIIIVCVFEE